MTTHGNILILKRGAVCLLILTVARVIAPVLYSLVPSPHQVLQHLKSWWKLGGKVHLSASMPIYLC